MELLLQMKTVIPVVCLLSVTLPFSIGHLVLDSVGKPLRFLSESVSRRGGINGESWGYVTVRPKAHMFYWLYETTHPKGPENRPLILWLQGGPGGSGVGFGNFLELGPLDVNLKPRNTTWLQTASLLFIDNPVGAGYSYAEDDSAFTKDLDGICADLLVVVVDFMKKNPAYQKVPFYIFSESYGGKMTAGFSAVLSKAISQGSLNMNFKGLAMGDSWIDPVSYTDSWGPYLYSTSIISKSGLETLMKAAGIVSKLVNEGKYKEATQQWSFLEEEVERLGGGVNFYNILEWSGEDATRKNAGSYLEKLYNRHVGYMQNDALSELMNGPIREKLGIIPKDVTWGGQSGQVFEYQAGDFMKSVAITVNDLINAGNLTVVVYNGQLDLICDTLGTSNWFFKYTDIASQFKKAERRTHSCHSQDSTCYFSQSVKNFQFYWIMKAGHMVPEDNGNGALAMVNQIIGS